MLDFVSPETPLARREPTDGWDVDLDRLYARLDAAFSRPALSGEEARRLAALAERAAWAIRRRRDADELGRLRTELERQTSLVRRLTMTMIRTRDTMDGALSAARAGVFECDLADERLSWTSGVYELFGMPRGSRLQREDIVACYAPASRRALDAARRAAIRDGSGFRLDAEIETFKGARRWIRLSCVVERRGGAPSRLYGLKQDITEERALADGVRLLAEADALTGLANRRLFQERLESLSGETDAVLMLIDLDGFKQINDSFGHLTGDECLKQAASRLAGVCKDASLVARIGGDEFAVLFASGVGVREAERRAKAVVEALKLPVRRGDFELELGASVGIAASAGLAPAEWIERADAALYAAKAAGRRTFRCFAPSMSAAPASLLRLAG